MMNQTAALVLAAGDGTRMKSKVPKVCCQVLFKPMLSWVLEACQNSGIAAENTCVVVSDQPGPILALLPTETSTAVQAQRLGTGHAVQQAASFLQAALDKGISQVAVLCGDAPFVSSADLTAALQAHKDSNALVTVLTAVLAEGGDYGRILRDGNHLRAIVEKKNADAATLSIREINSGVYWFETDYLLKALPKLVPNAVTGEYYLTDLVRLCGDWGGFAAPFVCSSALNVLGANSRAQLAELNLLARNMLLDRHYQNGVDIPITDGVMIGPDVTIGADTTILPGCILSGKTVIGTDCVIGPNTLIEDCTVGDSCTIDSSRLTQSQLGSGIRIGPFAQLRPNCVIHDHAKIGNFVEVKNSTLGEKTSLAHLTYIGDSDFGSGINVGCGVVTVNYDGVGKYRTVVEDNAFIGCNTNLIAPVTVGKGAYVAAASTVIEDVASDALAIGRCRVVQKAGYASKLRKK